MAQTVVEQGYTRLDYSNFWYILFWGSTPFEAIFTYYIYQVKRWYDKIIRINHVENKEIAVYDHLIPLQSIIIMNLYTKENVESQLQKLRHNEVKKLDT